MRLCKQPGASAITAEVEIRAAAASDLGTAKEWLAAAGLPTEDLSIPHMDAFLFASERSTPVGMIGVQKYSEIGLLRSLIVDEKCRGKGLGAHLVAALESKVAAGGITELWLLTLDADPFFSAVYFYIHKSVTSNGQLILGYLVPFGKVGIEIVFAGESAFPIDCAMCCKGHPQGIFYNPFVQDGEHAGHPQTYGAGVRIGRCSESS